MKRKRSLPWLLLIMSVLHSASYAQIAIQKRHRTLRTREACWHTYYESDIPILPNSSPLLRAANDSIRAFAGFLYELKDTTSTQAHEPCDSLEEDNSNAPGQRKFEYEVHASTRDVLSMTLYSLWAAGGIGTGASRDARNLNLDLRHGRILGLGDVLLREKIHRFSKVVLTCFEDQLHVAFSPGYDRYAGFAIVHHALILGFDSYMGHGHDGYQTIRIPLEDICGLVRPECLKWDLWK